MRVVISLKQRFSRETIVKSVDTCLDRDLVVIGDLIYCEVLQGIKIKREREKFIHFCYHYPTMKW